MNSQQQLGNHLIVAIKLFVYSQSQTQLSCLQLNIHPHKTLKQLGLFLYHDEKINFNDFVFTDRPFAPKVGPRQNKKLSSLKSPQIHRQVSTFEMYVLLDSGQTVGEILKNLHVDQQGKSLLMIYSKKEMDAIVQGNRQTFDNKVRNSKIFPPTYRNSARQGHCLIF